MTTAQTKRLVHVVADLATPARLTSYWPAPLDELLASALAGPTPGNNPNGPNMRARTPYLPIARARHSTGNAWWWWASCGEPEEEVPGWASRFDHEYVLLTGLVGWWAIGDPQGIQDAIASVHCLFPGGRDKGRVGQWAVTDEGEVDYDMVLWTADDLIARPIAARHAVGLGLPADVDTVPGAYRPPYHRQPQPTGATGDTRHAWRDVIAPWVHRPPEAPALPIGARPTPPAHPSP